MKAILFYHFYCLLLKTKLCLMGFIYCEKSLHCCLMFFFSFSYHAFSNVHHLCQKLKVMPRLFYYIETANHFHILSQIVILIMLNLSQFSFGCHLFANASASSFLGGHLTYFCPPLPSSTHIPGKVSSICFSFSHKTALTHSFL